MFSFLLVCYFPDLDRTDFIVLWAWPSCFTLVFFAEPPGSKLWQTANESQTTTPGGRYCQKRETDRRTVGSHKSTVTERFLLLRFGEPFQWALHFLQGSEFTRSLVDKKREGSVVSAYSSVGSRITGFLSNRFVKPTVFVKVLNGLKQRILKLEQQCREKENALW